MSLARYIVDPLDPRAPTQEQWENLSPEERQRVVAELPSELPRAQPPEGDVHRVAKTTALDALDEFYRRTRRRIYLSSELPVYYPGERLFAPDLIAVLDAEPHARNSWIVSQEGKGIDLALEIHVAGRARKDLQENVERYARLGIDEYFVFDAGRSRLLGWRLVLGEGRYEAIVPQAGRWPSRVLELDLSIIEGRLRFFHGSAPLLDARELVHQLSTLVDQSWRRAEEEARRAEEEAQRAARLAERLRELGVDPDDVK